MVNQSQFIEKTSLSSSPSISLKEVVSIVRKNINPTSGKTYTLYSFQAYDNQQIPEIVDGGEIRSCKLNLTPNTVLYNKLNVRLCRVWNVREIATTNNICSTEFIPLKMDENVLLQEYLVYFLTSEAVTKAMVGVSQGTSNSQKRIAPEALLKLEIPLPPIEVQKEFVAVYEKSDKSKFAGFKSQFIEDYYNRYEPTNLGAHISVIRGVSYKPADIRETGDEAVAILRSNNISDGEINYEDLVYVSPTCVSEKQFVDAGDIVMCGSNGSKKLVGKAGLIAEKQSRTSFGAFCLGIRCKKTLAPEYLNVFFNSQMYRDIIEELGNGTNIINIRPDHITSLSIPIPEKNVQNEFVELTRQADKSKYLN